MKVNCYFFSSLYVSFFFFQCNHRSDYHRYRDNRRNSRDYRQKEWVLDLSYIPFTHLIYLTSERLYYILILFATLHYWVCMKNKYSFFKSFIENAQPGTVIHPGQPQVQVANYPSPGYGQGPAPYWRILESHEVHPM